MMLRGGKTTCDSILQSLAAWFVRIGENCEGESFIVQREVIQARNYHPDLPAGAMVDERN